MSGIKENGTPDAFGRNPADVMTADEFVAEMTKRSIEKGYGESVVLASLSNQPIKTTQWEDAEPFFGSPSGPGL